MCKKLTQKVSVKLPSKLRNSGLFAVLHPAAMASDALARGAPITTSTLVDPKGWFKAPEVPAPTDANGKTPQYLRNPYLDGLKIGGETLGRNSLRVTAGSSRGVPNVKTPRLDIGNPADKPMIIRSPPNDLR